MKRLLILVEGHTEKRVVSSILRDHLSARGVDITPTILDTKPPNVGPRFKGGVSTWRKIQDHLKRLLRDTAAVGVTTMIDYYGLPNDVPGMMTRPNGPPRTRVEYVERAIGAQIDYSKVIHGPLAAQDIGLGAIRAACPHFADWLTWMESLGEHEDGDRTGGNSGHEPPG